MSKFKKGDKVWIPTRTRSTNSSLEELREELRKMKYREEFVVVLVARQENNIGIEGSKREVICRNSFHEDDLDLYEEVYRFKTKEEFIAEYGEGWRKPEKVSHRNTFVWAMDHLLGTSITNAFYTVVLRDGIGHTKDESWTIHPWMLTNKPLNKTKMKKREEEIVDAYKYVGSDDIAFPQGSVFIRNSEGNYTLRSEEAAIEYTEELIKRHPTMFVPIYRQDESLKIGIYYPELKEGYIKYGCKFITRELLLAYKGILSDSDIKAELKIHGTVVTAQMVDKLLKLL